VGHRPAVSAETTGRPQYCRECRHRLASCACVPGEMNGALARAEAAHAAALQAIERSIGPVVTKARYRVLAGEARP